MKKFLLLLAMFLPACNVVNIKPGTIDKSQTFLADRGGYTMKLAAKQELEKRGYKVIVGKNEASAYSEDFIFERNDPLGARYIIRVSEKEAKYRPYACIFSGFWWWSFSVSIADQQTGKELLAWAGRGCANGNIRRFNRLMDKLEIK